ncbi:MAG: ParB/RepB/Spo0J family partition protein [Gammaproteobacteria bacterium]|nr:ParB/RepB/Spo0J family partition protein [Gammaproteobacteria bacterium]
MDSADELRILPVDLLQRSPFQPRQDFNQQSLQELADSIRAQGIIQPIVVRTTAKLDRFEIIAGERRWRAAQLAGLDEVPTVVRRIDDQTAMCLGLIENIQREDLNPMEQAHALSRLLDEFRLTHEQVAEAVGRSRSTISNLLRLLELDPQVRKLVESRSLDMGHARAILALPGARQMEAARHVIKGGLSARATEALVRRMLGPVSRRAGKPAAPDPNVQSLERQLAEKLGAAVRIRHGKSGKGRLEIGYTSLAQLDGILGHIK